MEKPPYLSYETKPPSLGGLADEEQARCIWCGEWWYKIHHQGGVCHSCRKVGKPTLTQLRQQRTTFWRTIAGIAAACALVLWTALS